MKSLYQMLEDIVGRIISTKIDYSHPWHCKIVSQSGDSADVAPMDPRLPNLLGVPIRTGVPGVTAVVSRGAMARVHFDDADPAKPFIALWDISSVESISLGTSGLAPVARQGDAVVVTLDVATLAAQVLAPVPTGGMSIPGVIMSGSSKVRSA